MPSFDIVSEVDKHELTNAVDQASREITNRFDFKGLDVSYQLTDEEVTMRGPSDFQVSQMLDILQSKLIKRDIDVRCMDIGEVEENLSEARQVIKIKQGLDKEDAKKVIKFIKEKKLKVQTSIQGEQVRVTGKKRDDLQTVIAALREEKLPLPLQYINFRD